MYDQACSPHKEFLCWLVGPKVTYVPPTLPEDEDSIFAHYETGINFDKYDDIMVDVSGTNPPQAIMVRSAEVNFWIGWKQLLVT